jgi:hypothetical protein
MRSTTTIPAKIGKRTSIQTTSIFGTKCQPSIMFVLLLARIVIVETVMIQTDANVVTMKATSTMTVTKKKRNKAKSHQEAN